MIKRKLITTILTLAIATTAAFSPQMAQVSAAQTDTATISAAQKSSDFQIKKWRPDKIYRNIKKT